MVFFARNDGEQAILVMYTLFTSHAATDEVNLETRKDALGVSALAREFCVAVGLTSAEDARMIQRRDLSFLSYLNGYRGNDEGDTRL